MSVSAFSFNTSGCKCTDSIHGFGLLLMSLPLCLEEWFLPGAPLFHRCLPDRNRAPVSQQFAEGRLLGGGRNVGEFAAFQGRPSKGLGDEAELFHVWFGLVEELRDLE